ncbi:hypothetical protein DFH07DRAFT_829442 [Mycena maculata]|uniref:Transmembrane protein n=1 Tax=Mycena maculata TaxID=230809 RepID=A0AAD7IRJ5_9AGAR|nr:hypothetical protein DFH07DRAFT_829442 [Mycena maculata]
MLSDVITYMKTPTANDSIRASPATMMIDDKVSQPPPYADLQTAEVRVDATALPTTISEAEWRAKLQKLQKKIRKYNWTKRGDEAAILESMRDLAKSHNDRQVQAYWTRRADDFEKAPEANKKSILIDIGRGLAILIAAPFAIAGAVLVGTGMLLTAGGKLLSGGMANSIMAK